MLRRLRLFPLNTVLFPGATLNLHIFEPRYGEMLRECLDSGEGFGVALIADGAEAGDSEVTPYQIGAVAEIRDVIALPQGRYYISTVGSERFRIREIVSREPYLLVEVEVMDEPAGDVTEQLVGSVRTCFDEYAELLGEYSGQKVEIDRSGEPQAFSYAVADALLIAMRIKQRLLEVDDVQTRLRSELDFLQKLLPQLRRVVENAKRDRDGGESGKLGFREQQTKFYGKFFSQN